jgi:hypothetical protein
MTHEELALIYNKANKIFHSDLQWSTKYDLIFSSEISQKLPFDWFDPDMDYEDDVCAFMLAFKEYFEEQEKINNLFTK